MEEIRNMLTYMFKAVFVHRYRYRALTTWMYIFLFANPRPRGGGQYYELLDGLGGKYADLLRKKREFKGEEVGKRGYFHCTWGKQYNFGKRAGGKNIIFFLGTYTPLLTRDIIVILKLLFSVGRLEIRGEHHILARNVHEKCSPGEGVKLKI